METKKDLMKEYISKVVKPILSKYLQETQTNTMGVYNEGGSVRLYWRPNNYRLKIPFNKKTFKQHTPKKPSFPVELKISNYGSKHIFKIREGVTIVIDKESLTAHYSLKNTKGNKQYYEIDETIEDFEKKLYDKVEEIKNTMFRIVKEIIRCFGGVAFFENANWLRYEDGNIGDEFADSLPENRIIFANNFKKVYKNEIEFTGKKGDYPTAKLINYIDNQALERQSPKILQKLTEISQNQDIINQALKVLGEYANQIELHLKVEEKTLSTLSDLKKYIGIIAEVKVRKIKEINNQTKLKEFISKK